MLTEIAYPGVILINFGTAGFGSKKISGTTLNSLFLRGSDEPSESKTSESAPIAEAMKPPPGKVPFGGGFCFGIFTWGEGGSHRGTLFERNGKCSRKGEHLNKKNILLCVPLHKIQGTGLPFTSLA